MVEYLVKKRDGFTLVELIVVIVLMGILSAVVIPRISPGFSAKMALDGDAEKISSALMLARDYARRDGDDYRVIFAAAARKFDIVSLKDTSRVIHTYSLSKNISFGTPSGTGGSNTLFYVDFDSDGRTQSSDIPVKTNNGETKTVSINMLGTVSVQ